MDAMRAMRYGTISIHTVTPQPDFKIDNKIRNESWMKKPKSCGKLG
jgi:hypothetical protein